MAIVENNSVREMEKAEFRIVTGTASLTNATASTISLGASYRITHCSAILAAKAATQGDGLTCVARNQVTYPGQFIITAVGASGTSTVEYFVIMK